MNKQTTKDDLFQYNQYVLDVLPMAVFIVNMVSYDVLYANPQAKVLFGNIEHKTCWKVIQRGQTGPCAFCNNHKIIDQNKKPTQPYRWVHQNTVTGRWYDIIDVAVELEDGRLVKFVIAMDITDKKQMESSCSDQRFLEWVLSNFRDKNIVTTLCQNCNHIRDKLGNWHSPAPIVEKLLSTSVSYGICPKCIQKYYSDLDSED